MTDRKQMNDEKPIGQNVTAPAPEKSAKPSTFEIVQIAAILKTSVENEGRTPSEMVELAMEYWKEVRKKQYVENERRILLATIGKIHDEDNLFNPADSKNNRRKGLKRIRSEWWYERFFAYPGDKCELFCDVLCTELPLKEFWKILFPGVRLDGKNRSNQLIQYGGNDWAFPIFQMALDSMQGLSSDIQSSLSSTFDPTSSYQPALWLETNERFGACRKYLDRLYASLQSFYKGNLPSGEYLPAILCRGLIHMRQMEISRIRSPLARRKMKKQIENCRQNS